MILINTNANADFNFNVILLSGKSQLVPKLGKV